MNAPSLVPSHPKPLLIPQLSQAPAATLHQFARAAREQVGEDLGRDMCQKNASRDAHRFVAKWGLTWKIPFSYIKHEVDGDPNNQVAYISPKSFIKFLAEKAPELLLGGCTDKAIGCSHLAAFWGAYEKIHPSHKLFHEQKAGREYKNTFALAMHGDEGRGLKKSNTTIIMLETCLGITSWSHMCKKRTAFCCDECELDEPMAKRFRVSPGLIKPGAASCPGHGSLCQFQATNLKQHSFLTKFVLAALPHKDAVLLEKLSLAIVRDMISLFEEGVLVKGPTGQEERWYAACTGMKGDLKWFQKIGQLTRSFASQIGVGAPMCHECMAGTLAQPFEDGSDYPKWASSRYTERPFAAVPIFCHIPFEAGQQNQDSPHERFFRRDIFHNTKMGVFRDFVASCVLLLCKLKYFNDAGGRNDRDSLLERAHHHFAMFCRTTGRSPALRSFSSAFFNAKSWVCYPWVNCKGSDCALLLAWVHVLTTACLNDLQRDEHVTLLHRMNLAAGNARAFQRASYSHGLWMHKHCGRKMYGEMHRFIQNYNACAFLALHQYKYTGFAMKSKFHMLCHAKLEILELLSRDDVDWIPSLQMYGCEGNEDMVGKLSRLTRRVNARLASRRALELYLIKSKACHRRFKNNQDRSRPNAEPPRYL